MTPPWSVRLEDRAPLGLIAMLRGEAWAIPDDGQAVRLDPGAVAIMKGPQAFTVADDPQTPAEVVIHPEQRVTTPGGDDLGEAMNLGVRAWGNDPHGSAISVIGCFQMRGEVSQRLLDAMPLLAVLTPDTWESPLVRLLDEEIVRDEPGQQAVLDRLFDLLLIAVVRAWFARPEADAPAWYRAHNDPVIGRAVRMLHDDPAHPWTVAGLASAAGLTRARFARRFTDLVGQPPMTYLTSWRLALAADLLREPTTTVEAVARQVGYSNGFALSTAFKRVRGTSPTTYRRTIS
jgi:AraC-like DNA-binding protein